MWTFGRNNGAGDLVVAIIKLIPPSAWHFVPSIHYGSSKCKHRTRPDSIIVSRLVDNDIQAFRFNVNFASPVWSQSAALSMLTRNDAVILEWTPRSTWRSIYFLLIFPADASSMLLARWLMEEERRAILRVHNYAARFKFTSQNWFSCPGIRGMAFAVNPSGISIRWFAILFGSLDANQNAIDFGLSVIKKFSFGAR